MRDLITGSTLPIAAGALIVLSLALLLACSPAKTGAEPSPSSPAGGGAASAETAPAEAQAPVFGTIGPSNSSGDETYRDSAALAALIADGGAARRLDSAAGAFLLLDVRSAEEFAAGALPGALLLPWDSIESRPPAFPKDGLVIVYCRSGNRSAKAKAILQSLGWKRVVDFGGLDRWKGSLLEP